MNNKSTKNIKRIISASFLCFQVICSCCLFSFAMFCRLHCFVVYVVLKSPLQSRFHGFVYFILFCLVSFVFFHFSYRVIIFRLHIFIVSFFVFIVLLFSLFLHLALSHLLFMSLLFFRVHCCIIN